MPASQPACPLPRRPGCRIPDLDMLTMRGRGKQVSFSRLANCVFRPQINQISCLVMLELTVRYLLRQVRDIQQSASTNGSNYVQDPAGWV